MELDRYRSCLLLIHYDQQIIVQQMIKIPQPVEYPVPSDLHPNLRKKFLSMLDPKVVKNGVLLLKGAQSKGIADDDQEYVIDQESNFHYLFGVSELDCHGILELDTGKTVLFTTKIPDSSKVWQVVKSNDEIKQEYNLDQVLYIEGLQGYLATKQPKLFIYYGIDSDSKRAPNLPDFEFLSHYSADFDYIYPILNECRVFKTDQEIGIMRYIARVSSASHINAMQSIGPGNKEYQIEALFQYHTKVNSGCKEKAYDCICGSGRNAATLHYTSNSKVIQDDQLILCDMGAKYHGYCSDITVTFPSNGKFNQKQKIIYNAVLDAQQQVYKNIKVGVNWGDLHLLAEGVIVTHLLNAGLLKGSLSEIKSKRIGQIFLPHGLGHLLGLRVHDVGGYNKGCPARLPELSSLRFRRDLQVGMVFTNEPGCYFIPQLLDAAYADQDKAKYLNKAVIDEYLQVGGVRLEDDIALTVNGPLILNSVPRTIDEVEACMQGKMNLKRDSEISFKDIFKVVKEQSIIGARQHLSAMHIRMNQLPMHKQSQRISTECTLPSIDNTSLEDLSAHFAKTTRKTTFNFELNVNKSKCQFIENSVEQLQKRKMNSTLRDFSNRGSRNYLQREIAPRSLATIEELEHKMGSVKKTKVVHHKVIVPLNKQPINAPTFFEEFINAGIHLTPGRGEGAQIASIRDKIYLYGGQTGSGLSTELWMFDLTKQVWSFQPNTHNLLRTDHTMLAWKQFIVIFGGSAHFDNKMKIREVFSTLAFYNTVTNIWSITQESVEPRRQHKAIVLQNKLMIVTGGLDAADKLMNDTIIYSLETRRWIGQKIFFEEGIAHHAMAIGYDYKRSNETVYLFGGMSTSLNSFPLMRLVSMGTQPQFWEVIKAIGSAPSARWHHTMESLNDTLIVIGGMSMTQQEYSDDIFIFSLMHNQWVRVDHQGVKITRWGHCSCIHLTQIICFGGMNNEAFLPPHIYTIETDPHKIRGKTVIVRKQTEHNVQESERKICRLEKFRNARLRYEKALTYMPLPQMKPPRMRYDILKHFVKCVLQDIGFL